jgi:hypothetical protein
VDIDLKGCGLVAFVVLVLVVVGLGVLAFYDLQGKADRAAADRASAEARLTVARAEAYGVRADANMLQAEQSHRHFLEVVPVLVLAVGGVLLLALFLFLAWDVLAMTRHKQETRPTVLVLTDARQREFYAALEVLARHRALDSLRHLEAEGEKLLALSRADEVDSH